jgi:hypothetical protein
MRRGQSVRAGEIPDQVLPSAPRIERGTIRAFVVIPKETRGLKLCVDLGRTNCSKDYIIGERVSAVAASTATTGEAMVAVLLNLGTTDTTVRSNQWCTKAKAYSYA